jgi:phosphatidylserine decarboxylase
VSFPIDRSAWPFVAIAAVPAVVCGALGWRVAALVLVLLPIAIACFFRDPARHSPADPVLVLSPADGTVMHAGPSREGEAPDRGGPWLQVTIFLSVLDVHINRTPVAGRVTNVSYRPGTFLPAYRHDAHRNERSEIWIDHEGTAIVARQVVGMLARRVVCRVAAEQALETGARIGLMKFGSRMDVFVPPSATLAVKPGDKVRGGETVIARLGEN